MVLKKKSLSELIIDEFASQRRSVFADWRFEVAFLRVTRMLDVPDVSRFARDKQLRKMLRSRSVVEFPGIPGIYQITLPFASLAPISDEMVIQDACPSAVFSHLTALHLHKLVNAEPKQIYASFYPKSTERTALEIAIDELQMIDRPRDRFPACVGSRSVVWTRTKREWDFGFTVLKILGGSHQVYVSDVERTLIDAIRAPAKCGSPETILNIWEHVISSRSIHLQKLISYVDRFDQKLLRQRVGFLAEAMGVEDRRLSAWASESVRGGSAKLIADAPFAPVYSERWNLSVNVAPEQLRRFRNARLLRSVAE